MNCRRQSWVSVWPTYVLILIRKLAAVAALCAMSDATARQTVELSSFIIGEGFPDECSGASLGITALSLSLRNQLVSVQKEKAICTAHE